MLLHIRPRLYLKWGGSAELVSATVEPVGLRLRGSAELKTGRPYPNKRYWVGYRRTDRKAVDGILIEIAGPIAAFSCAAQWAVDAERLVTHHVDYRLVDSDFDAASDDTTLWHGSEGPSGVWASRWSAALKPFAEVWSPLMEVGAPAWPRTASDVFDANGFLTARHEVFYMPTIERERITASDIAERRPSLSSAFHAPDLPARSRPAAAPR